MNTTRDIIKRILLEQDSPEAEEYSPPNGPPYSDYYDVGLALRRIVIDPDNGNWIDTDYIDEESIQTSWDLKEAEQMYQKKLFELKFFDTKGKENRFPMDEQRAFNRTEVDIDVVLELMKYKYGYGDLAYGWLDEFEEELGNETLSTINSLEYADLLHRFIQKAEEDSRYNEW